MLLSMLFAILTSFILIDFFKSLVKSWNSKIPLVGVPLPLIGHIHHIFGSPEMFYQKIKKLSQGKSACGIFMGPYYTPLIYDVKILTGLLRSEHKFKKKSIQYEFFRQVVEKGIFSATGKSYRNSKRVLMEAVSPPIIKEYVKSFNECSRKLVENLKPLVGQSGLNLEPEIMLCVITNTMCKGFEILSYRIYSVHLYPNFIFKSTKFHQQITDSMSETRRILRQIILLRKEDYDRGSNTENKTVFIDKYFEMKKEDGSSFTIEDIVEDVISLFLAAIETTAVALSSSINLLAIHKNVQEKAQKECDEMNVEDLDIEHNKKLVYLDQIISEVMRLYPPVMLIGREFEEDVELANGGHLTKATNFLIYINGVHMNSEYYPNPTVFNPDHFLPDKIKSRPALAYIPFGLGSRKCFGNVFSNLFVKTVLYHLLRNYSFDTTITEKDFRMSYGVTTKNKIGVPVVINTRK